MNDENIQHTGVIVGISDGVARVKILQTSACAECHAKGMCSVSELKEKVVDAELRNDDFSIGDTVNIVGKSSLGIIAVLLAYVMPFLLIVVTMVVLNHFIQNELVVGTVSLAMLIPYFFIMRLFNKRMSRKFRFYVTQK